MTTALAGQLTLTVDQLRAAAARIGVHEFPVVLALRSAHRTINERDAALDLAARELVSRRLIGDATVHSELDAMMQALHRPERELAVRLVTPDGTARMTVVRSHSLAVLSRRVGDQVTLRAVDRGAELPSVTAVLAAELPKARPADIISVAAPLPEMAESLSTADPREVADRIRRLGADSQAAMLIGAALGARQAFAEITYYAHTEEHDMIARGPAAVAVLYTKRGRVIATPSASPSGQLWTTLNPGSDHALARAIRQLIALSDHSWGHP